MARCWAVIPAKHLTDAKSRLGPVLSPHDRRELVSFLLERILQAVAGCRRLEGSLVITRDPGLAALAAGRGAVVVAEQAHGLNRALIQGRREAWRRGSGSILILPSDLPYVDAEHVAAVVARGEALTRGAVVVPAAKRGGTNALYLSPPDLIRPAFGRGSFPRHLRLAAESRAEVAVFRSRALAFDLDTAEDLAAWHRHGRPLQARGGEPA